MEIVGSRTDENKVYYKLRTLHRSMMLRCYNKNSASYKRYGGRGVTVDEEWHNLNDFIATVDLVEGFDIDLLLDGKLQLDKDIKGKDSKKVYSIKTCKFVTPLENYGNRENNLECVAVDLNRNIYHFHNREEFCRQHSLSSRNVYNCLQGTNKSYKGWQFFYKKDFHESKILSPKTIKGINPSGEEFIFNNVNKFSKEHNLSAPNISMVLNGRNKTHNGWRFILINDGFIIQ